MLSILEKKVIQGIKIHSRKKIIPLAHIYENASFYINDLDNNYLTFKYNKKDYEDFPMRDIKKITKEEFNLKLKESEKKVESTF